MAFKIVSPESARRDQTEAFVRKAYLQQYQAVISAFPRQLVASLNTSGDVVCAAGIRDSRDGFFSERYLDAPVEFMLNRILPVDRSRIFEVSNLVSNRPAETFEFIESIIAYGADNDFRWAFFTVTKRLGHLLHRLGLDLQPLADAAPSRVTALASWGTYYDHAPRVFAVERDAALSVLRRYRRVA